MSHPEPPYDKENNMSQDAFDRFDEMAERTIWPWIDDEGQEWSVEDINYDDYNDFTDEDEDGDLNDSYDDSMDGDFDSAMRDAGFGTDEDYGFYGEDY
jgi:hypothetical protein